MANKHHEGTNFRTFVCVYFQATVFWPKCFRFFVVRFNFKRRRINVCGEIGLMLSILPLRMKPKRKKGEKRNPIIVCVVWRFGVFSYCLPRASQPHWSGLLDVRVCFGFSCFSCRFVKMWSFLELGAWLLMGKFNRIGYWLRDKSNKKHLSFSSVCFKEGIRNET